MAIDFTDYDLKIAQRRVNGRVTDEATVNIAFYENDHWQQGTAYIGPRLPTTDPRYPAVILEIERTYIFKNAIGEIVDNHVNGVLGRELHWQFSVDRPLGKVTTIDPETGKEKTEDEKPTDEEDALIDEAEQALTAWWDNHEVPKILQDAVRLSLLAKRAPLRMSVPPGKRDEFGNIPRGDLAASLGRIWVQHLGTNEDTLQIQLPSATVYTDKRTRQEIGIFTYKEAIEDASGAQGAPREGADLAELCYVDESGNTVLRIIGGDGDIEESVLLPLGGRLTLYEMTRRALVSRAIVSQQKELNLSETMKRRNIEMAGFLERTLMNADLPGAWVTNSAGAQEFIPTPIQVGASTVNAFQGIKYKDAQGNEHLTDPTMIYRDPVPVTTFTETSDSAYLAILQDAHQLHLALAGDAVVSAVSRVQAQDSFQKDLLMTAGKVEAAARWVLETALAMAAHFAGTPGRFDGLRAVVQARINPGPISADEKRVASEMKDKGLWSWETAASQTGIEDTDAEKERIEKEKAEQQGDDAAGLAMAQQALDQMRAGQTQPVAQPAAQTGQAQPTIVNGQEVEV